MANTRLISIRDLSPAPQGERPVSQEPSALAEALTKTRLIPLSERFAAREPMATTLPTLSTRASRASLQTTLAPIEHLLAQRAPSKADPADARDRSRDASSKPSASRPRGNIRPGRRILVAALVGSIVSSLAIAAKMMGAGSRPPSARENAVALARPAKSIAKALPPTASRLERSAPVAALRRATGVTLERAASDAIVEGRFDEAAQLYERLAQSMPQMPVYKEAARILRERAGKRAQ